MKRMKLMILMIFSKFYQIKKKNSKIKDELVEKK